LFCNDEKNGRKGLKTRQNVQDFIGSRCKMNIVHDHEEKKEPRKDNVENWVPCIDSLERIEDVGFTQLP